MRALIFSTITGDPTLNSLGITATNSSAVDMDTPESRPFLQIRWGTNQVGLAHTAVSRRTVTIWVHDEMGDYTRVDSIIYRLKSLLPTLEGESHDTGHVVSVEWIGDSEDLIDDGHKTVTRNTSFELVGSGQ